MTPLAPVHDPRTGGVIDQIALLPEDAVGGTAQRAALAAASWAAVPLAHRAALLAATARVLAERAPSLVPAFTRETGKTPTEAQAELARTSETLEWIAQNAQAALTPTPALTRVPAADLGPSREAAMESAGSALALASASGAGPGREVTAEPAGPALAIVPSNFPAVVTARKAGAALVAGCPVVVKAPETAPSMVRAFVAAAHAAGVPEDVLQVVFTTPAGASALVRRPEFRTVSFTGATRTGRLVAAAAAETLASCVLELGGHAPAIITADADLDAAVAALVPMKFGSAGQSCAAPSRFLVAEPVAARFVALLLAALPTLDRDPGGTLGPLHTASRRTEVHTLVDDAVARGATLRAGGTIPPGPGWYYPATVLTDLPPDARILTEEPFGPLAPVQTFTTEDEAVALANTTPYALGAFLFGDPARVRLLAPRLNAGRVCLNLATGADPASPLSGRLDSGYGYEGGPEGIQAFTRLKTTLTPSP